MNILQNQASICPKLEVRSSLLTLGLAIILVGCGGGGTSNSLQIGGSIQGFNVPASSKAVLLSLSSESAFRLAESSFDGTAFNVALPELPNDAALGLLFEAPTGCTGVTLKPADAEGMWASYSLEVAGQPAGELLAKSGDKIARWVYADEPQTLTGTLTCPALTSAARQRSIGTGTTYDLTLQQGWNLVLSTADESSFVNTPFATPVTWSATTPNDLSNVKGTDANSTISSLKGTLGAFGYKLALQLEQPGTGVVNTLTPSTVATTGADGNFDLSLPPTPNTVLLGAATGLNQAGCEGTINVSSPSALLGKLGVALFRGNDAVGKASLVSYSTTIGWWYVSSAINIAGQEKCGGGDESFLTKYNLNLQAGWNLVLQLEDSIRQSTTWSNLSSIPSGGKWLLRLEDNGVGIAPGTSSGADAGSSATRMHGKLGGWTDTEVATLKLESDKGIGLANTALSVTGEFDLTLPITVEATAFEPLELTQGCGAGITSTPTEPTGVKASLEPDRNSTPLGVISVGGRGFVINWVYASSAVTVTGKESCPTGDGTSEDHNYNINFTPGWNLLIEQVFVTNGVESTEHKSGTLPAGSQWFFKADKDAGLPDTGSTTTTLSGSVGGVFANATLRLMIGSLKQASNALNANGDVTASLPATVPASALKTLNPARPDCTGALTVTPATSKYGVLSLEIWDKTVFKSPVEITNEDSDGSLEKLSWWYLEMATTINGTQTCPGLVDNTFKYNLSLNAGWNLVLDHEEEHPSGERNTKFSIVSKVPDGTRWGTN